MSRSTTALKRLGVAGIAAVTLGAGIPAFFATSAVAADAAQLTISPSPGQAAAGVCQVFTVNATDNTGNPATYLAATPTLQIDVTENPVTTTQSVSFCDVATSATTGPSTGADPSTTAKGTAAFSRATPTTAATPTQARFGLKGLQPGGANIRVYLDGTTGSPAVYDAGELTSTTTTTFTAGGTGNTAQDAVRSISETGTVGTFTAGQNASAIVQVRNAAGNLVSGVMVSFRVTSGPNGPQPANTTTGTPATPGESGNSAAVSDNNGEATISYLTDGTRFGTDTIQAFVNQTTGSTSGPDAGEPTVTLSRVIAQAPTTDQTLVRNVAISPKTVNTVSGGGQVFTASVTTSTGRPVQGTPVTFNSSGAGRFADGTSVTTGLVTGSTGQVTVRTSSVAGETGTQVVIASVTSSGNQTQQPAGTPAGATAGNSSDGATQVFALAASPSPSASASPSATSSPSATPTASTSPSASPACSVPATVSLERDTIIATGSSGVTVTAPANSIIDLYAYTRPSTTYRVVRSAEVGTSGTAEFRVVPPANTRLYAQVRGCTANIVRDSKVLNVRTALSLFAKRNSSRNYTFSGDSLPARPGGLIVSLYRVTASGSQILTAQTRASASNGNWTINRVFTGEGRFGFVVRTGQDLQNAPGASNVRPTLIF